MSITSKELAALAGVSRGTVDRALNHRGGVRPQVQQRIEALAREYGYSPNRAGKALVTRSPVRVAVLLHSVGNPFFDEVKQGLRQAAEEYSDFPVEIHLNEVKGYSPAEQLDVLERMEKEGMDGLILTPISHADVSGRLNRFAQDGLPVVALNNDIASSRLCYVGCDYTGSGRTAAQMMGYLCGGQGRVAVVVGSLSMLGHRQRAEGFSSQLETEFPAMSLAEVVENNDDDHQSAEVVAQLMRHHSLRGLYFAAAGAASGSRTAHSLAGGPLAIVASDPVEAVARLIEKGLVQAAIGQQPFEQGYRAMRVILERLLFQTQPSSEHIFTQNEIKIKTNL